MKILAILLVCLLTFAAASQVQTPNYVMNQLKPVEDEKDQGVKEVLQVVAGILVGAFDSTTSISACFDDSKDIFSNFKDAYVGFKQGTFSGIEDGLIHVGKALLKLPSAIEDCKSMTTIVSKFKALAVKFSNPTLLTVTVGKNILWHSVSIYGQVTSAISAYGKQDYYNFGVAIGKIMDMVFLSKQKQLQALQSSGEEFFKGFAHGISPSTYEDVEECLDNISDDMIARLKNDVDELSIKHISRSVDAMKDIGEAFIEILTDCSSSAPDVIALVAKLTAAFEGEIFINIAKAILKNPLKFISLITSFIDDWNDQHYFAAGDDMGEFLGKLLGTR